MLSAFDLLFIVTVLEDRRYPNVHSLKEMHF